MADEDLDRENDFKISALDFLRFELPESAVNVVKSGALMQLDIEHPHCFLNTLGRHFSWI